MRTAIVTVTVLLLAAAIGLTLWSRALRNAADTRVPPGQYPVDAARFEWPASERTAAYGPAKGMGTNKVRFAGGDDVKARCATAADCNDA